MPLEGPDEAWVDALSNQDGNQLLSVFALELLTWKVEVEVV